MRIFLFLITYLFAETHKPVVKQSIHINHTNSDQYFSKIRLKDLATFEGIRDNQLVGYGLVVGLNGSGDTLASSPYTKESLISMLERLGVNVRDGNVPSGKNVAAVMVTATFPPFARHGTRIDVSVSALGDAKDLRGGILLVTPLYGADGEVYSVAQGNVSVSGITASGSSATVTKGVPTAGTITNGAIIEKEIDFNFEKMKQINLSLRNPDFTTAERTASKINTYFNQMLAHPKDPSTIQLTIPEHFKGNIVSFMTEVEQLRVDPDQTAKVVIDDTNGVIVVGKDVRTTPVAITQGNITVSIIEQPMVSQPNLTGAAFNNTLAAAPSMNQTNGTNSNTFTDVADSVKKLQDSQTALLKTNFETEVSNAKADNTLTPGELSEKLTSLDLQYKSQLQNLQRQHFAQLSTLQQKQIEDSQKRGDGNNAQPGSAQPSGVDVRTVQTSSTDANIVEEKGKFTIVDSGISLEELVNALNSLGVTPKEMGSILRAIKAAGSLQADIKET